MIRLYATKSWHDGIYPIKVLYKPGQLLEIMCWICKRLVCVPIEEMWTEYRHTIFQCQKCKITLGTVEVRRV